MKQLPYTVLITASGVGFGLGTSIAYMNKTLLPLGEKPVISYIIDSYPKNTCFVITLGYYGKQVKDFLTLAYPHRTFIFVPVDPYQGKGSSLGFSMLMAKKHLQKPFIYHASDTIVVDRIAYPHTNWLAGFNGNGSANYTSFNILNGKIQRIMEKGISDPDYLHIGLVGIRDFKKFWKSLQKLYKQRIYEEALADFHVVNDLIDQGVAFLVKEYKTWYDTGNIETFKKAEQMLSKNFVNLNKQKEAIFILDKKKVIKFYSDAKIVDQRVKRSHILTKIVPKITRSTDNFFMYTYVRGDLYANIANTANFPHFLDWAEKKLWKPIAEVTSEEFEKRCFEFYYTKTVERIKEFSKTRGIEDSETIINDEEIPSVKHLLENIDFTWLAKGKQTYFHGDFILDNIIKTEKEYVLLDWRQNFGGLLKGGDIYYDLAKLNHNLIINHAIISKNLYTITMDKKKITCDILRKDSLISCQKILFDFLETRKYDRKKVQMLTGLIWFNSAPLHHRPYDYFLYYNAKRFLWKVLNNHET